MPKTKVYTPNSKPGLPIIISISYYNNNNVYSSEVIQHLTHLEKKKTLSLITAWVSHFGVISTIRPKGKQLKRFHSEESHFSHGMKRTNTTGDKWHKPCPGQLPGIWVINSPELLACNESWDLMTIQQGLLRYSFGRPSDLEALVWDIKDREGLRYSFSRSFFLWYLQYTMILFLSKVQDWRDSRFYWKPRSPMTPNKSTIRSLVQVLIQHLNRVTEIWFKLFSRGHPCKIYFVWTHTHTDTDTHARTLFNYLINVQIIE